MRDRAKRNRDPLEDTARKRVARRGRGSDPRAGRAVGPRLGRSPPASGTRLARTAGGRDGAQVLFASPFRAPTGE